MWQAASYVPEATDNNIPGAGLELYAFICIGDYPFLYVSIGRRLLKKFGFPLEILIDFALGAQTFAHGTRNHAGHIAVIS